MTSSAVEDRDPTVRNVVLLAICQALAMTGMSVNMTVTALVGQQLASDPAWATLPLALQFTATMLTTLPASFLMRLIGRRSGFALGISIGIVGALIAFHGIFERSFLIFVVGSMMIGCFQGFAVFYRHAAADTASQSFRSKAISLVLAGGVFAALVGPELSKWSYDLFSPVIYAGCFIVVACVQALSFAFLYFVRIPPAAKPPEGVHVRPLSVIVRQPTFLVAAIGAMIGYGVMSFVMTATPLAIMGCGYEFRDAAFVIQWHVLAMYAPSFFTGSLIQRFGVRQVMLTGAIILTGAVAVNVGGIEIERFWLGLVLLGVGWNFMFVGGTSLLAECHTPEERAKVQGLNDFLVFGTVTASSFASGALLNAFGWNAVNYGVLPLLGVATAVIAFALWRQRVSIQRPQM